MNETIGFWRWLYKHIKANIGDVVKIVLTLGGLCGACLSLVFGDKVNPLFLFGVPFGVLSMLYGIYRMAEK